MGQIEIIQVLIKEAEKGRFWLSAREIHAAQPEGLDVSRERINRIITRLIAYGFVDVTIGARGRLVRLRDVYKPRGAPETIENTQYTLNDKKKVSNG